MVFDFIQTSMYYSDMKMSKYDRLLYILNLLRTRKNMNAEQLSHECEVTERTIYRDIVSLSEANIPIYYDNGYKYASGNFLPPLNFNIDEFLTLKKILESSPLSRDGQSRKLIKSIKTKIEAGLSPFVKEQKRYAAETTDVKIRTTVSEKFSSEFFAIIENGIRRNIILDLTYNSIESGIMRRNVEPYFLIFIERAFYFVAFCHIRQQLRTFRIDRIISILRTDNNFIPRKNINPAEYFENSWGVFSGKPVEIEAVFTGKAARIVDSGRHHKNEKITHLKGGRIKYEVTIDGINEICRWFLGFGGEVTVLKPSSLIRKIKETAEQIQANY